MHGYSRSPSVKAGSCSLPNLSTCRPIPSFPSCLSAPVTTPSPSRHLRPPANPSMEDSALALCLHSPMARVVLGISLSRMTRRVRLFTGFEHGCALWSRYSPRRSYLVLLRSGPQPNSQSSLREWYGRVCDDCLGLLYIRSRMTLPDHSGINIEKSGKAASSFISNAVAATTFIQPSTALTGVGAFATASPLVLTGAAMASGSQTGASAASPSSTSPASASGASGASVSITSGATVGTVTNTASGAAASNTGTSGAVSIHAGGLFAFIAAALGVALL